MTIIQSKQSCFSIQYHEDFNRYRMYRSLIGIEDFIQGEISSFYCSVTKDR